MGVVCGIWGIVWMIGGGEARGVTSERSGVGEELMLSQQVIEVERGDWE
jgi:hypothetical protein